MVNLFEAAKHCIHIKDPDVKIVETRLLAEKFKNSEYELSGISAPQHIELPGLPDKLRLVHPRKLTRRSVHTLRGKAALLHAIAHIEFNAINLALDAVYRFRDLPRHYYVDWLRVASEEAYHFSLINNYLRDIGFEYGDFVAHNGLWDMALKTTEDVLIRMALVPRVMEARGLDVTPGIIDRFSAIGDQRAVDILNIIFRDEVGHVEIGTSWFYYFCDQYNLPRQGTFEKLMKQYMEGRVKLPLHHEARKAAGFSEQEIRYLEGLA